jgi:hypothetical protein
MLKKCSKCGNEYPATTEFFYAHKGCKDGLTGYCKSCHREYGEAYRKLHPEKTKEYDKRARERHPEERRKHSRDWGKANKERKAITTHVWYERITGREFPYCPRSELDAEERRERRLEYGRRYREENHEELLAKQRAHAAAHRDEINEERQERRRQNVSERISSCIRTGMCKSLHGQKAGRHWEDLVGYTVEDLMKHLGSRFQDGMTLNNFGEWEIDHVLPVVYFNFVSTEDPEFKECWSLENLQPLWAKDNRQKNSMVSTPTGTMRIRRQTTSKKVNN